MVPFVTNGFSYRKALSPENSSSELTRSGNLVKNLIAGNKSDTSVPLAKALNKALKNERNDSFEISSLKKDVTHLAAEKSISGRGYIEGYNNNSHANATFTVKTPKTGDYKITLRYGNASGDNQNLDIYVNNAKIKQTVFPNLKNEDTRADKTETFSLSAGENQITIKAAKTGSNVSLDYISMKPQDGSSPEIKYEAEDAVLSGGAKIHPKEDPAPGTESLANKFIDESKANHSVTNDIFPQKEQTGYTGNHESAIKKEIFLNSQLRKTFNVLSINTELAKKLPDNNEIKSYSGEKSEVRQSDKHFSAKSLENLRNKDNDEKIAKENLILKSVELDRSVNYKPVIKADKVGQFFDHIA